MPGLTLVSILPAELQHYQDKVIPSPGATPAAERGASSKRWGRGAICWLLIPA